jgi:hypothetical protein
LVDDEVQPKALRVLFYLVHQRSRSVDRHEILRTVWPGVRVGEDVVFRAGGIAASTETAICWRSHLHAREWSRREGQIIRIASGGA